MIDYKDDKIDSLINDIRPAKIKLFWRILIGKTFPQKMFRFYLLVVILGAVLLYIPTSLQHGYEIYVMVGGTEQDSGRAYTFWDALFVSCSAITDTGLTPIPLALNYTGFSQAILLILTEIGGIGIMTIIFFIWTAFKPKNKQDIKHIIIAQQERGNENISTTQRMISRSVVLLITVQIVCAFIIAFWLCWMPLHAQIDPSDGGLTWDNPNELLDTHNNFALSLWQGLYVSVSATDNAAFDVFQGINSLGALRNDWNIFIQILILFESVLGGIGFPLIFDLIEHRHIKKQTHESAPRLSLFTKIALLGFIIVTLVGITFSFILEYTYTGAVYVWNNGGVSRSYYDIAHYRAASGEFGKCDTLNRVWAIIFNSMNTRSTGMYTVNATILSPGSQWLYTIMMFIGGSPSSTAGGIRTTTFIIMLACVWAKIRGRKQTRIFHRGISVGNIQEAFGVTIVAIILVLLSTVIIFYDTPLHPEGFPQTTMLEAIFESASAFGTVGLSMGMTPLIGHFGQVMLVILMFMGQLGISTTLLSFTRKKPIGNDIAYPEEIVKVG